MVLATKSKSFKDSAILKLITIIISIALCISLVYSALPAMLYACSFSGSFWLEGEKTIFEFDKFNEQLRSDVCVIDAVANYEISKETFEANKAKELKAVTELFKKAQSYYNNHKEDYGDYSVYYENEADENEEYSTTMYVYSNDARQYLYEGEDGVMFEYYCKYGDLLCPITLTEEEASACFSETLDEYGDQEYAMDYNPEYLKSLKNLTYYAVGIDGTVVTNATNPEEFIKNIKNSDAFYFYTPDDNGVTGIGGSSYAVTYSSLPTLYLQYDTSFSGNDIYQVIFDKYFDVAKIDIQRQLTISAISLAGLAIMLIIICTLAGHKNGERVTYKIDRMPNDLHLLISGGLLAGDLVLAILALSEHLYEATTLDSLYYASSIFGSTKNLLSIGIYALIVVAFLIVAELLTSIARQAKAHTGYFKNMAIYAIVKKVKKLFKNIKELLSYQPNYFKRGLILLCIGYFAINVVLAFFGIFGSILLAIVNIICLVFIIKYFVKLDVIITAAHNRELPQLDYSKLPNSLKILADSIRLNNEELNDAVDKAVRDEKMRTELITNVSHDLKTPLTSIINYVDLLKQCDIEDEKAIEYIAVLDEKGEKLKRLIEDLIEASKASSGVITINAISLDLNELVAQAIGEVQQDFTDNELELILQNDSEHITALADGNKAFRVIENLLSNARKYSARASRVYCKTYYENDMAVFEIKNMSAEPLNISPIELKERFVRGDKSRNMDGNGLGLSIADSFCRAMGGQLELSIDGDLFKARVILPKE